MSENGGKASGGGRKQERGSKRSGATDALVVPTAPLANLLKDYIKKYRDNHPRDHRYTSASNSRDSDTRSGPETATGVRQYGSHQHIADHMPGPMSKESKLRALQRVQRQETTWTNFDLADDIMTAMGYSVSMFEELRPVPNPKWSRERWEAWRQENGGCEDNAGGLF